MVSALLKNPTLSNKKNRQLAVQPDVSSYEEFLNYLYDDLEVVITRLSQHKDKYAEGMKINSKQGENLINTAIVDMLYCRGYEATHDTHINGNADIVVGIPHTDYCWIAESKINKGSQYINKGFKQLLYRYSTGLDNATSGGVIIYATQTKKTQLKIMEDWKDILDGKDIEAEEGVLAIDTENDANVLDDDQYLSPAVLRFESCPKSSFCFYSYHMHPSSGKEYSIRHMCIDFRYVPKKGA